MVLSVLFALVLFSSYRHFHSLYRMMENLSLRVKENSFLCKVFPLKKSYLFRKI